MITTLLYIGLVGQTFLRPNGSENGDPASRTYILDNGQRSSRDKDFRMYCLYGDKNPPLTPEVGCVMKCVDHHWSQRCDG